MGRIPLIVGVVVALVAALAGYLWIAQNSALSVQPTFDLYVVAWQSSEPVSVVALMGAALGTGVVMGAVLWSFLRVRPLKRRLKTLEQQSALGETNWR